MPPKKDCSLDKIKNPTSGRCIIIGSDLFKKLIRDPNMVFSDEDYQKIKKAGFEAASAKALPSPKEKVDYIVKLEKVPVKTSNKVLSYLNKQKDHDENYPFISKKHKQYCKNQSKYELLEEPLVGTEITFDIPYSTCPLQQAHTFVNYLDGKKIPYTSGFKRSINIMFNNYNRAIAMQLFKDHDVDVDLGWFHRMNKYIMNLSSYDAFTVLGYSNMSHLYINKYLRDKNNFESSLYVTMRTYSYKSSYFPFYMQMYKLLDKITIEDKVDKIYPIGSQKKKVSEWLEWCKGQNAKECYDKIVTIMHSFPYSFMLEVMELFQKDLSRIIQSSPPLDKELVVYRGVGDDYFMKNAKNQYYKNETFLSCSLDPYHSYFYMRGKTCCFKRIVLLPGVKALFISGISCYPREMEILVDVGTTMFINEYKPYKVYDAKSSKTDICFSATVTKEIMIADIVMAP